MKKHLHAALGATLLSVGFALNAQTAFKLPPINCTDVAFLQQQLPLAPNTEAKVRVGYLLVFADSPPATFQDAAAVIANVTAAHVTKDLENAKIFYTKQYAYFAKKWLDDLAVFCEAHPSTYDVNVALRGKLEGRPWAGAMLIDRLRNHTLKALQVPKAINALIECNLSGEVTNEDIKDILQTLNLRYTNLLAADKERWAPVVAQIRTLLEQY